MANPSFSSNIISAICPICLEFANFLHDECRERLSGRLLHVAVQGDSKNPVSFKNVMSLTGSDHPHGVQLIEAPGGFPGPLK